MNAFKKIYTAIIVMTIISLIVACLTSIGTISLGDGLTGLYIAVIVISIIAISFVFSRAANVIANRKNAIVGYLATFVGLIELGMLAISLIFKVEMPPKLMSIITYILIYLGLLISIFEIPEANSSHGKFQKIAAIVMSLTFGLFIIDTFSSKTSSLSLTQALKNDYGSSNYDYNDSYNYENSYNSGYGNSYGSNYNSSGSYYDDEEEENKTSDNVKAVLSFASIGMFILNPMLRVYYIDRDYTSATEIDKFFINNDTKTVVERPNPTAQLSDKYKKQPATNNYNPNPSIISGNNITQQQTPVAPAPVQAPMPTPAPVTPVVQPVAELPQEKVVNPNFKQDDLPEAIIPSINVEETTDNQQ